MSVNLALDRDNAYNYISYDSFLNGLRSNHYGTFNSPAHITAIDFLKSPAADLERVTALTPHCAFRHPFPAVHNKLPEEGLSKVTQQCKGNWRKDYILNLIHDCMISPVSQPTSVVLLALQLQHVHIDL
jgi:hypothetical protein